MSVWLLFGGLLPCALLAGRKVSVILVGVGGCSADVLGEEEGGGLQLLPTCGVNVVTSFNCCCCCTPLTRGGLQGP